MFNIEDSDTTPIEKLDLKSKNFIVKARATNKSAIKSWSNERGSGILFTVDLHDHSGEIKCVAFYEEAKRFHNLIENGNIYYISNCKVKKTNIFFNHLNNKHELILSSKSEAVLCGTICESIPLLRFKFKPFTATLSKLSKNKSNVIDVIGIAKLWTEKDFVSMNDERSSRRKVWIVDENNYMIIVIIQGSQADLVEFDNNVTPVIAIRGAKISEYVGRRNLFVGDSSAIYFDPDIPEAHKLRNWFDTVGIKEDSNYLSKYLLRGIRPLTSLGEAVQQRFNQNCRTNIFIIKAMVGQINVKTVYMACPKPNCREKLIVLDEECGEYECKKCLRQYIHFRYILEATVELVDWTGALRVTVFNNEAEKILGLSSEELIKLQNTNKTGYLGKLNSALFKSYIFKLSLQIVPDSDKKKLFSRIMTSKPINNVYRDRLLSKIKELADITN